MCSDCCEDNLRKAEGLTVLRAKLADLAQVPALAAPEDGPATISEGRLCGENTAYHESLRLVDELIHGYGEFAPPAPSG